MGMGRFGGESRRCRRYWGPDPSESTPQGNLWRRPARYGFRRSPAKRRSLSRGDDVDQSRRIDGIEFDILIFQLLDEFLAFGLNHCTDDLSARRRTDADAHFSFELAMEKTIKVFRHRRFGEKIFVVGQADVGFPRERPVVESLASILFGIFRIG